jgi:hypothetical protein
MWHPRGFTSIVPSHLALTLPRLSSFSDDMVTGGVVTGNVPHAFAITRPSALRPSCPCLKHSRRPEVSKIPSTPASMVEINPPLNPTAKIFPHSMHRLKGFQCSSAKCPFLCSHILQSPETPNSQRVHTYTQWRVKCKGRDR